MLIVTAPNVSYEKLMGVPVSPELAKAVAWSAYVHSVAVSGVLGVMASTAALATAAESFKNIIWIKGFGKKLLHSACFVINGAGAYVIGSMSVDMVKNSHNMYDAMRDSIDQVIYLLDGQAAVNVWVDKSGLRLLNGALKAANIPELEWRTV